MRKLAFLLLILFLSSCLPDSEQPLSSPDSAFIDDRLKGLWISDVDKETGDYTYFHFVSREDSTMDLVAVAHSLDRGADIIAYIMFPTEAGARSFMNLKEKELGRKKLSGDYIFMDYGFPDNNTLSMRIMNNDSTLISAVESGKLKGRVHRGVLTEVTLTDESSRILEFIKSIEADELFSEPIYLHKVK